MLVFSSSASAQDDEPFAGGYISMPVTSAEAQQNARFAVASRAKRKGQKIVFVKLLKAKQQVVAGMNYRLCMRVRVNGRIQTVTAVVFQNLQKRKSLTSWNTTGDCG